MNRNTNAGCDRKYHVAEKREKIFTETGGKRKSANLAESRNGCSQRQGCASLGICGCDRPAALDSMAAALPYAKMLTGAPMAIVVCGDTTKSSYWYLDCSAATQNILLAAEALDLGAVWTAPIRMTTVWLW